MSVVQHFLKWLETAKVSERAAAAAALARAYLTDDIAFEDRCAAEAALTFLLDDPSPKVRLALSEVLSLSHRAPLQIIAALAADQPDVAGPVLVRSPLLDDGDLIDRVATGSAAIQRLVAMRPHVSMAVAASIAEVGELPACMELLDNSGAEIASLSFRRMMERHGGDARFREKLVADWRLPADCRHMLVVRTGEALRQSPLVLALMGASQAEKLTRDACIKASLTLIDNTAAEEHPALVEHLRIRGDLTAGFVMRAVANGKIDFFGAALAALTGQSDARIRSLLAGGRDVALAALFGKAGLASNTHAPILTALKIWRQVANGKRVAGVQEVSWLMLKELNAAPGQSGPRAECRELAKLLKSIHLEALRQNARVQALAIAAA